MRDSAGATRIIRNLEALSDKSYLRKYQYEFALGTERLAFGDNAGAITHLQNAVYPGSTTNDFNTHFYLGQAYLAAGRISDAVGEFERLLTVYSKIARPNRSIPSSCTISSASPMNNPSGLIGPPSNTGYSSITGATPIRSCRQSPMPKSGWRA